MNIVDKQPYNKLIQIISIILSINSNKKYLYFDCFFKIKKLILTQWFSLPKKSELNLLNN
jgi:hypothetical protein